MDLRKENTIYNPKTNSSPVINFAYFFFQISPTNKDSIPSAAKVAGKGQNWSFDMM